MRVIVTGGAGFIGANLCRTLTGTDGQPIPVRTMLVPARVKHAHARQLAHREFAARGSAGNRVLLFVSLGEHYVEIIADHDTHAAAEGRVWDQTVSDFVQAVQSGHVADGIVNAVEACGQLLRQRVKRHARHREQQGVCAQALRGPAQKHCATQPDVLGSLFTHC